MIRSMKKVFALAMMCTMFLGITFSAKAAENETTEITEIKVQGLERESIKEVTDITEPLSRSSCGINHVWSVKSEIQEENCDKEGIYRVQCVNCGATGTVTTDAPGHNYVNGVCSVCGEKQQGGETDAEVSKWEYTIDEATKTLTLDKYISNVADVVIYGSYKVNGTDYTTKIKANGYTTGTPFYENNIITSVRFEGRVVNRVLGVLFNGCKNLKEVDFTNFVLDPNTNNDFIGLFYRCSSLKKVNWGNLDTSSVWSMRMMFCGCTSLENADISQLNTSNVTSFSEMFDGCTSLKNVNFGNIDTKNVGSMSNMFEDCVNLSGINLSGFNTSNVKYMDRMFSGCKNLISLDLSNFKTSNATDMGSMFKDCTNLTNIHVNRMNWNTSFADTTDMFTGCGTSKVTPK